MKKIIKILVLTLNILCLRALSYAQLNAVNEGNFLVSPINGYMQYSYPISNTTIDGFPLEVKVNYVSNLTFSAFEFHGFTEERKDTLFPYRDNDACVKLTKTSPAWIIGVNGFAIQVLSQNQRFHSNYSKEYKHYCEVFNLYGYKQDGKYHLYDTSYFNNDLRDMAYMGYVYKDDEYISYPAIFWNHDKLKQTESDNIWLIDGYDYCNNLQTPDDKYFQDYIHLLRDDGSILELKNTAWQTGNYDERRFTGLYYEEGINTNGFALVDYDTNNYWPTYIRSGYYGVNNSLLQKPRVVKYYPGNGLEYVFKEYVSPFGTREDLQKYGEYHLYMLPKATIFYLEEINSSLRNLSKFERNQHKPTQLNVELLRGRALIKNFANHKIAYSNNEITIETFGQKYALSLRKKDVINSDLEWSFIDNGVYYNEVKDSIDQRSKEYFNYTDHDGYNNEIEGFAISKDSILERKKFYYANKSNGSYYIDKIIDPMGNIVTFDYESKIVKIGGLSSSSYNLIDTNFYIYNLRMNKIASQRLLTKFTYLSGDNTYSYSSSDTSNLDPDQYSMIDSIEVFDNLKTSSHSKIASVDYDIIFDDVAYPGIFRKSTITNRNYILNLSNINELSFSDYRVKPIRYNHWQNYYSPDLHYPLLMKSVIKKGDEVFTTEKEYQNFYDNVNNEYKSCFIIDSITISSFKKNEILMKKSKENHFYEFEKLNDLSFDNGYNNIGIEGDLSMDSAYNWGIKKHTIARYTSLNNINSFALIDSTEIYYINLPFLHNQDNYRYDKNWDKESSDYYNLSNLHFGIFQFGNIFNTIYNITKINVPPIYGLDSMVIVIKNGDTLGGIKNVYERNFDPGPTAPTYRRGALLRDSVLAFNSDKWEFANKYDYNSGWERNLLNKITDNKGRFVNSWYDYNDIPGCDENNPPNGLIMKNNQESDPIEFYQRYYQFERPLASTYNVRNYIWDGSNIKLDTTRLNNIFELNNYGLTSGYIDPNGWYYQTKYDELGRTTVVRYPYDFPSNSATSSISSNIDECVPITMAQKTNIVTTSLNTGSNYQYQQSTPVITNSFTNLEFGNKLELISSNNVDSLTIINKYQLTEKIVTLTYEPSQYDIFHRNASITDLQLKLLLEVAPNNCSNINLKIPELNYETNVIVGCYPISILPNSCDLDSCEYKAPEVLVDLNDVKSYFEDLPLNQTLSFIISSGSTGGFFQIPDLGQPYSPCLSVSATETTNDENDFTYKFVYDNVNNQQLNLAKIDDKVIGEYNYYPRKFPNTQNNGFAKTENFSAGRYTGVKRVYSAAGFNLRDSIFIGNPYNPVRTDVFSNTYNTDKTIIYTGPNNNFSKIQLDAKGRPIQFTDQLNNTSNQTTEYLLSDDPLIADVVDGEEYFGICIRVIQTNELGIRFTKYLDGLGRLRMTIDDDTTNLQGHFRLKTKYVYNDLNQLSAIVNPKGDTTFYYYDKYGRVIKKYQIDLDSVKYQYDKTGQLRFSQNMKQKDEHKFSFVEYDDLGRRTIVGEAKIENVDFQLLKPDTLNIGGSIVYPYTYTSNPTIWKKNGGSNILVNSILSGSQNYFNYSVIKDSIPTYNVNWKYQFEQKIKSFRGKFLMHPANYYEDIALPTNNLSIDNFEDISNYPQFIKSVVNYDKLPHKLGYVWEKMPNVNDIKLLTPFGDLRNLKGNQSAIAYRDNEDEPFHYVFFSYDARGRVEAIVRWTENIGFDVVHYTYNSMNMVNTVTAIDGLRQFTTWNVYDDNGRLWKVYSKVGAKGFHTGNDNQIDGTDVSFPEPLEKPTKPDITYTYNELGAVSQVKYKSGNDSIFKNVTYNSTGNVTNISVLKNLTTQLFSQSLERDATGNITQQISQKYNANPRTDDYSYDYLNRITGWTSQINGKTETATYSYDAIGNFDNNCTKNSNNVNYNYKTKFGKITNMLSYFGNANSNEMANFFYDSIGAVDSIYGIDQYNVTYYNKFNYSSGSILKSLKSSNSNSGYNNFTFPENESPMTYTHEIWNWNYRTGAFSVREQKRLMTSPHGDTAHKEFSYSQATNYAHFWEYNLVGAGGEELIQYKGFQTASSLAGANGRRVYIAPNQYIVPGGEVRITNDTNVKEIYITDHLGSVRCIVSAPITIKHFDYDPFGAYISKPAYDTTRDGFTSAASDIEEGESNFMQMGVRMYSARIGRFLSVDPLHEIMPSHNPYHYAFNSPLVWKDPSGLAPEKDKNIHSEKLLTWVIKFESSITDEVIVTAARYENESASYVYFDVPVHATAEFDAGTVNNVSTSGFYYGGVGSSRSSGKWGGNPKSNHHLTKDGYGNKGAWKVTKKWDASYIKQYEKFAGRQAEIYKNNGDRFACEDLALQVLIDFASQNGLPVILQNDVGVFNASDTKWNTYSSPLKAFRDQILSSTNSNHILKFNNTNVIEVNDLVSGDMLVQVNEKGRGHHTQLVRDANSFWIEIIQGNTEESFFRRTGNPSSIFGYVGTELNTSYYNRTNGAYYSGNLHRYFNANILKQFLSRKWNFIKFNLGK